MTFASDLDVFVKQIREKIKLFIINSNNNGFNKIKIFDNSK